MERKKGLLAAGCLLAVGAAAAAWFGLADEDHTLSEADAAVFSSASPAPAALTLSLDAAPDGAEFCLQNGTGMQLDTGGVNRLEKRTGTAGRLSAAARRIIRPVPTRCPPEGPSTG